MLNVVNKTVFKRAMNFFIFGVALTVIATIITYIINPEPQGIMNGMDNSYGTSANVYLSLDPHSISTYYQYHFDCFFAWDCFWNWSTSQFYKGF